ncbi:MAG TPA: tetratricopeptide repeat protein [Thermomicrobiales bacterium]|nr:tetratricopeptide repeat protein [Thermomicrobiales bacterium]
MYRLTPQLLRTSFVGRERDARAIADLFARGDVRIVTLTGPGGVGKTRLAFHVLNRLESALPDGVVIVDLATITIPDLVLPAIAHEFGIMESGAESIMARLVRVIGQRRTLLLVDNFEQVAEAGMVISRLASDCPNVAFLVTSRMPLHIAGEHEYTVSPLETPPVRGNSPNGVMLDGVPTEEYPAVRLFIERAQAAHRAFAPTPEMVRTVGEITALLDGLPLAIELAAARTKLFSLQALLNRLDDRMGLLTGGPRDLPDRLQTMRNAIAWSYDILSPEEKAVFRRVSIFPNSFSLEAAEAVVAGPLAEQERAFVEEYDGSPSDLEPIGNVLGHLESLADKSLLQAVTGLHEDVRFRMLLTIQEFGREQLRAERELLLMRMRLLVHSYEHLANLDELLFGPEQRIWLDRLDLEQGNIRGALQFALEYPREFGVQGVHLASSVWRYWLVRGHVAEGARWLEQALACRDTVEIPVLIEAEAVNRLGNLLLDLGKHEEAERHYRESLALYRSADHRDGVADELNNLGLVQLLQGRIERARSSLEESLALRRDGGDPRALPNTLSNLGDLAIEERNYDRAESLHMEALSIRREIGNLRGMALSCCSLGQVAFFWKEFDRARRWFDEGLEYQTQVDDSYSLAMLMLGLGRLDLATGRPVQAMKRLGRALEVSQRMGSRRMVLSVIDTIATSAVSYGFDRDAIRLFGTTQGVRERENLHHPQRECAATDRVLAMLTQRLGESVVSREHTIGRRQWLNQAVQEAAALIVQIQERLETGEVGTAGVNGVFDPAAATRKARAFGLTRRERQVLALLVRGASDKEIAEALSIAPRTAMTHVSNVLAKLGVNRRTAAASYAIREGLVDPGATREG